MSQPGVIVIGVAAETSITVVRTAEVFVRPQALVLDADHLLSVGTTMTTSLALWSDTAPLLTTVLTSDAGELRLWNAWRDDDFVQSWEGASTITVDDHGEDLGLTCVDGHADGPAMVVRLSFDRSWTQP